MHKTRLAQRSTSWTLGDSIRTATNAFGGQLSRLLEQSGCPRRERRRDGCPGLEVPQTTAPRARQVSSSDGFMSSKGIDRVCYLRSQSQRANSLRRGLRTGLLQSRVTAHRQSVLCLAYDAARRQLDRKVPSPGAYQRPAVADRCRPSCSDCSKCCQCLRVRP
jgi:hypothetical protein